MFWTSLVLVLSDTNIKLAMRLLSQRLRLPERNANHSPLSTAEVYNGGVKPRIPHTSSCKLNQGNVLTSLLYLGDDSEWK
jgi:hypothetical protein